MAFPVRIELAEHWGYGLEFGPYATIEAGKPSLELLDRDGMLPTAAETRTRAAPAQQPPASLDLS